MKTLRIYLAILLIMILILTCSPRPTKNFNVLMIAVDDLRPELGCYGNTLIKSPNIDELARSGLVFRNSYCNIPVSGASRASLLTGLRPTRNRFITYYTRADVEAPEATSLPQHFRNHGYYTISNGKVFHHMDDKAESWDENWRPKTTPTWRDYHLKENISLELQGGGPAAERVDVPDTTYHDGKLAEKTIADLKRMKEQGKPFFLATGFVKPHLPFTAPEKYWQLYDRSDFQPTERRFWPENAPAEAFHNSGELRAYHGIPAEGFLSDSASVTMQHGYYACVSYIDTQIGKILNALDELGLAENTIVVLWGDHGWNLGEHGMWCKHCNFNTSLQAPLIIRAPGYKKELNSDALVEFIDIYPTLAELCDLPLPDFLEGKSLVPLLRDPEAEWTDYVISKYHDGLTLKTAAWAYTEWRTGSDSLISAMLYDHLADKRESDNLSYKPEYSIIADSLQAELMNRKGKDYFKPNTVTAIEL